MNATDTAPDRSDEIQRYLDGVWAALRDLSADVRQELIDDLPQHLAEIAADDPAPLETRLGSPDVYAAELRAAVGPAGPARRGRSHQVEDALARKLKIGLARARPHLATADLKVGQILGYERFVDFAVQLRPAWWVLRGYVMALVLFTLLADNHGVLPDHDGVGVFGWMFVLVLVAVSVRIGRRPLRLPSRARPIWLVAALLIGMVALIGVATADNVEVRYSGDGVPYDDRSEVYIYDLTGRPVTGGVQVYDRDGDPLPLGIPFGCEPTWPAWRSPERRGCLPTADATDDTTGNTSPTGSSSPAGSPSPSGNPPEPATSPVPSGGPSSGTFPSGSPDASPGRASPG
jgi:hypothetical protein